MAAAVSPHPVSETGNQEGGTPAEQTQTTPDSVPRSVVPEFTGERIERQSERQDAPAIVSSVRAATGQATTVQPTENAASWNIPQLDELPQWVWLLLLPLVLPLLWLVLRSRRRERQLHLADPQRERTGKFREHVMPVNLTAHPHRERTDEMEADRYHGEFDRDPGYDRADDEFDFEQRERHSHSETSDFGRPAREIAAATDDGVTDAEYRSAVQTRADDSPHGDDRPSPAHSTAELASLLSRQVDALSRTCQRARELAGQLAETPGQDPAIEMERDLESARSELDRMRRGHEELIARREELTHELAAAEATVEELREQLEAEREHSRSLQQQFDQLTEKEGGTEELRRQLAAVETGRAEMEQQCSTARRECDSALGENRRLSDECRQLREQLRDPDELAGLETRANERDELAARLEESERARDELLSRVDSLEKARDELTAAAEGSSALVARLNQQLDEVRGSEVASRAERDTLREQLEQSEANNKELESQAGELRRADSDLRKRIAQLEADLQRQTAERESLLKQTAADRARITELQATAGQSAKSGELRAKLDEKKLLVAQLQHKLREKLALIEKLEQRAPGNGTTDHGVLRPKTAN